MPLYEYECENCGDLFEVIQKFSDEPLTVHDKCGGKVHRILSAPALQFKGSGWYVNDYAKSGNSGGNSTKKPDGGSGTASSSGDSSSTSTTPASTSAEKSS
jgi:putative FmdB family regulatory protein